MMVYADVELVFLVDDVDSERFFSEPRFEFLFSAC